MRDWTPSTGDGCNTCGWGNPYPGGCKQPGCPYHGEAGGDRFSKFSDEGQALMPEGHSEVIEAKPTSQLMREQVLRLRSWDEKDGVVTIKLTHSAAGNVARLNEAVHCFVLALERGLTNEQLRWLYTQQTGAGEPPVALTKGLSVHLGEEG